MALPSQVSHERRSDLSIRRHFAKLKDPRRARRRLPPLQDIPVIALRAVIAGARDRRQIETFGRKRRDRPDGFPEPANGVPSHDTFERVFDRLKPQAFRACFREWVRAVSPALRTRRVAIDVLPSRGSRPAKPGPLHRVSAWATARRPSPGQAAVAAKSDGIAASPALPELPGLNGASAAIDAMGCRKAPA